MTNKRNAILLVALCLATISLPLFAHHGNAAMDTEKTITMKGTVIQWLWANPHCFLKLDYKNDKGEVEHWVIETSNPPDMINKGWSKEILQVGDEVTATMHPAKNGKPVGRLVRIVLPSGQTLGN